MIYILFCCINCYFGQSHLFCITYIFVLTYLILLISSIYFNSRLNSSVQFIFLSTFIFNFLKLYNFSLLQINQETEINQINIKKIHQFFQKVINKINKYVSIFSKSDQSNQLSLLMRVKCKPIVLIEFITIIVNHTCGLMNRTFAYRM